MRTNAAGVAPATVPRFAWVGLAILFLVLRLFLVFSQGDRPLRGDELSYDQIARNVATGQGFSAGQDDEVRTPTAARGPSYVLLVAGFHRLFGPDRRPLFLFQVLLDALCLLLLVRLGLRWFRSEPVALIAGVVYATYPPVVTATAFVLTETMTHLMILVWIHGFFAYLDRRRTLDLVVASVALGICALSKPHLALFAPVTCIAAWPDLDLRRTVRTLALVVVFVALTMSPWIVRNALIFREFVPGVTIGGIGILYGSGAFGGRTVGSFQHEAVPDSVRAKLMAMSETEANRWAAREAIRTVRNDPAAYARLSVFKVLRLWFNLGFDEHRPSRASLLIALFNLALIVLAIHGSGISTSPTANRLLLIGAVYWTLVHVPFFTNVRYVVPFLILLFPFAAAGLVRLVRGFRPNPGV